MANMRYNKVILFVLGVALAFASCTREESINVGNTPSLEESCIAGEILVKFSPEVEDYRADRVRAACEALRALEIPLVFEK